MRRSYMGDLTRPKGDQAAKARQKKFALLRRLEVPEDGLPGSLSLSYRRCGKSYCHCAEGEGHPQWQLTYMERGKKRVEAIPADWVEEVRERVDRARSFREGVGEVFLANAELLTLEKKQRAQKRKKKKRK
ncbi:MAG: hypothetical protein PVJ76_21890 [Gemmatimonadota bacterium]